MRDARREYEDDSDYEDLCEDCIQADDEICAAHAKEKADLDAFNARIAELRAEEKKRNDIWHEEHRVNEVFYEMKNLRIRRWQLEMVGLDADTIIIRELIGKQIAANTGPELITQIRILFSYFQMVPTVLCKPSPEIRALVQGRIDFLRSDPKFAKFLPLMLEIKESFPDR
jgi:hypothetical protein